MGTRAILAFYISFSSAKSVGYKAIPVEANWEFMVHIWETCELARPLGPDPCPAGALPSCDRSLGPFAAVGTPDEFSRSLHERHY